MEFKLSLTGWMASGWVERKRRSGQEIVVLGHSSIGTGVDLALDIVIGLVSA